MLSQNNLSLFYGCIVKVCLDYLFLGNNFPIFVLFCLVLQATVQFRSYDAKEERWFCLISDVTNFKATTGIKTITPAGATRYVDSNYSNLFSRLSQIRRDKQWLKF